jgi:nucleotidyltransferase substrate binding protein (TIGR01987 family)
MDQYFRLAVLGLRRKRNVPLELGSLVKAIDALKRSVNSADANLGSLSPDLQDAVKAGVIQHFEVAYEQCWKFIQRWIRENRAPEDADHPRSRKELFRMAARFGLISDPLPWFEFGDARNLTSHTYDAARAEAMYKVGCRFLPYAEELLNRIVETND